MKICVYIRLSSADDDLKYKSESESISNQRALLTQYLKDHKEFHPYEIVEFVDDGFSGTNGNRPGFEKMIEYLKDGKSKMIICKDLSRFFRDYVEIGDYLERIFPFLGIRFIAVNDGYDSDDYKGTVGGLDVAMKCIIYSLYSKDLSQKIKTVMKNKVKKGQFIGAFPPYGYIKDPANKNHLIPDMEAAPVVKRIFAMYLEGVTSGEIAKALEADGIETPRDHFRKLYPNTKKFQKRVSEQVSWSCSSINDILKRLEYTGAVVSYKKKYKTMDNSKITQNEKEDWVIVPGCHEAIVSKEDYDKVQAIRQENTKSMANRKNRSYLLRSLITCGCCGRSMSRVKKGRVVEAFYKCEKSRYIEDSPCPTGERFYEPELEKIVVSSLSNMLTLAVDEDKRLQEVVAKTKGTAENIRRNILRIEQTLKKNSYEKMQSYEQYSEGKISKEAFAAVRERITLETEQLTKEKAELTEQLTALENTISVSRDSMMDAATEFLGAENLTNDMLKLFIDKVLIYSKDRIEIVYNFSDPFKKLIDGAKTE